MSGLRRARPVRGYVINSVTGQGEIDLVGAVGMSGIMRRPVDEHQSEHHAVGRHAFARTDNRAEGVMPVVAAQRWIRRRTVPVQEWFHGGDRAAQIVGFLRSSRKAAIYLRHQRLEGRSPTISCRRKTCNLIHQDTAQASAIFPGGLGNRFQKGVFRLGRPSGTAMRMQKTGHGVCFHTIVADTRRHPSRNWSLKSRSLQVRVDPF